MKKMWRLCILILAVLSCAGCDRATKQVAKHALASSPPVSLLNDFVRFEYVENEGAMLGLGSNLPREGRILLFVVFAGAGLLLAVAYVARAHRLDLGPTLALSLFAGGGVGNLVDRIINDGAVTDFVSVGFGRLRTGVFNLADVAIMVGALVLVLWGVGGQKGAAGAEAG